MLVSALARKLGHRYAACSGEGGEVKDGWAASLVQGEERSCSVIPAPGIVALLCFVSWLLCKISVIWFRRD